MVPNTVLVQKQYNMEGTNINNDILWNLYKTKYVNFKNIWLKCLISVFFRSLGSNDFTIVETGSFQNYSRLDSMQVYFIYLLKFQL